MTSTTIILTSGESAYNLTRTAEGYSLAIRAASTRLGRVTIPAGDYASLADVVAAYPELVEAARRLTTHALDVCAGAAE